MQRNFILKEQESISPMRKKFPKFSDFKNTTISTAERLKTESDGSEDHISQFIMNPNTQINVKLNKKQNNLTFQNVMLRKKLLEQIQLYLREYDNFQREIQKSLRIRKQYLYREKTSKNNKKYLTFEKVKQFQKTISKDQYYNILCKILQQLSLAKQQNQKCLETVRNTAISFGEIKMYAERTQRVMRLISQKIFLLQDNSQIFFT